VTGNEQVRVVVAAGGLGTRVRQWARYLPKEFLPVDGRPGIVHVLEEISQLGPARVVIIHHPYYQEFADWARRALSPYGQARYLRAAGRAADEHDNTQDLVVDFIAQNGPYADLTSVINGADHFATSTAERGDMYLLFSDNLYPRANPLLALRDAGPGMAVHARAYRRDLAARHGVIATVTAGGRRHMTGLTEKPGPAAARSLERCHGPENLLLFEGRARLTLDFVDFARTRRPPRDVEPKLALTIGAYARTHPVRVIQTRGEMVDLGAAAITASGRPGRTA
jgi:UTP-glucose-1-phosphate uridylyltransferase